jgi:hypothetical protein
MANGGSGVRKLVALFVAVVFAFAASGFAFAQAQTAPKAEVKTGKPGGAKTGEKQMATKSASGSVKSGGADSVVVAGKERGKDAEWTFAVDSKTKIKKAGKDIPVADLKPGDAVQVTYTERGGKALAQAITVRGGGKAKAADKK